MRIKQRKAILTFHKTVDAIAMEKMCLKNGIPGRLIPVPTAITAGCGMSWCANPEDKETIAEAVEKESIPFDEWYELEI